MPREPQSYSVSFALTLARRLSVLSAAWRNDTFGVIREPETGK
jgi:hypothetical protein